MTVREEYRVQCFGYLRKFLDYQETIRGRSRLTVEEYFKDLRALFRFLKRFRGLTDQPEADIAITDIDKDFLGRVTLDELNEFLYYCKSTRGDQSRTLARKACAIRVFFRYLTHHEKELTNNPAELLETPPPRKTLPKYLTPAQGQALLQSTDGKFALRDFCMLTLLLNCGLRRAEVAGLNVSDYRPSTRMLRVLGKGNKERLVPLNAACVQALEAYIPTRPVEGVPASDRAALFFSARRRRMTVDGVHYVVKGYLGRIEGLEGYTTHKLRHTAATLMYQFGHADLLALKEILGHESVSTTEIYTHLSDEQTRQAVESHPLAGVEPPKARRGRPRKNAAESTDE